MPSKVKSKKSKSKRSVSTACWVQNDDGTFGLTIGSKKSSIQSKTSDMSITGSESDLLSQDAPDSTDYNGNFLNGITLKSPQPNPTQYSTIAKTTTVPILNSPLKILKATWSPNGIGYRERQQIKRRDEMLEE